MPEAIATPAPERAATPPRVHSGTAVAGLGIALPTTVLPNDPIAERIGVETSWIVSRTGIEERRVLGPGERLADLAADAGRSALADAGLAPEDLDMVLVATASADEPIPAVSVEVAGLLGAHRAAGLDIGAACTGFLAGLQLGGSVLEAGRADTILLIGAERLFAWVDPDDKRTAALFGDAAGAVVLTRTNVPGELGPVVMRSEPHRDFLYAERHDCLIRMEGQEVFKHAVSRMVEATHEALQAAGTTLDDIDLFVYHQANSRIIRSVGQRLGLEPERVVDCIARYGNVSAASLPLALAHARSEGRLQDGARVLLSAFGAGFVWGATVLDWRSTA